MGEYLSFVKFSLTFCAICFIICRFAHMSSRTRRAVRNRNLWLCAALIFSLVVPQGWDYVVQCLGLLIYLSYSDKRRHTWTQKQTINLCNDDRMDWPRING